VFNISLIHFSLFVCFGYGTRMCMLACACPHVARTRVCACTRTHGTCAQHTCTKHSSAHAHPRGNHVHMHLCAVTTLQRQLSELIEAKVGLEKDKRHLLACIADAPSSTAGPGQSVCSTPQSSVKRSSRSVPMPRVGGAPQRPPGEPPHAWS